MGRRHQQALSHGSAMHVELVSNLLVHFFHVLFTGVCCGLLDAMVC